MLQPQSQAGSARLRQLTTQAAHDSCSSQMRYLTAQTALRFNQLATQAAHNTGQHPLANICETEHLLHSKKRHLYTPQEIASVKSLRAKQ